MKNLILTALVAFGVFSGATSHANVNCPQQADIVDTAVKAGQFKTLAAALNAADLVSTLKGEGPFTVFAPLDSAFAKLPDGTVEALLKDIPALKNILLYHVVAGQIGPRSLLGMGEIATLQGNNVRIEKRNGKLFVNESQVVSVVKASNGIIYVVDSVLLP